MARMRILAHRGASGYRPENTYAAFDLACEMHADAIETDVRVTRDGVMVLFHDEKLDRLTESTGPLADRTFAELQELNAAARFASPHEPQRIPRLSDFLHRYAGRIPLCLEIKVPAAARPLADLLAEFRLSTSPNIELTSFEWEIITPLRSSLPNLSLGWLLREFTPAAIDQAAQANLQAVCPWIKHLTPDLVSTARQKGLRIRAWGAKTKEDLAQAHHHQIDGLTLNHPDWH